MATLYTSNRTIIKVFFSYSRLDGDFVRRLHHDLCLTGRLEARIDQQDVFPAEDWRIRIEALIRSSDIVIFAISPNFLNSTHCNEELSLAIKGNKRIIPIVIRRVPDNTPHIELRRRNYVFFDEAGLYRESLQELLRGIDTEDISWVRNHTYYGDLAHAWDAAGRHGRKLLKGVDIDSAERWLRQSPRNAPPPTSLHIAFITQSRILATRRQRTLLSGSIVGFVTVSGLAVWAVVERNEADQQRNLAQENQRIAEENATLARRKQVEALSRLSAASLAENDTTRALGAALEAAEQADDISFALVETALYAAIWSHRELRRTQLTHAATDAWFERGTERIVVSNGKNSFSYDGQLDWIGTEPSRRAGPGLQENEVARPTGALGRLWTGLDYLRTSTPGRQATTEKADQTVQRVGDRYDSNISIVRTSEGIISILRGPRETWTSRSEPHDEYLIDPRGRVVVFGPVDDGQMVHVGPFGTLGFFDTDDPERTHLIDTLDGLGESWKKAIAFNPVRDELIYSGAGGQRNGAWQEPLIVSTQTGIAQVVLGGHLAKTTAVDVSADGEGVLTLTEDGMLRRWSVEVHVDGDLVSKHGGCLIGETCQDEAVQTWSSQSTRLRHAPANVSTRVIAAHEDLVTGIVVQPNGVALSSSLDGRVLRWSTGDEPEVLFEDREDPPLAMIYATLLRHEAVYFVTAGAVHRLWPDGRHEVLASISGFTTDYDAVHGTEPDLDIRLSPGFGEGEAFLAVRSTTAAGRAWVIDVDRRTVVWEHGCHGLPDVNPRLGTILCPVSDGEELPVVTHGGHALRSYSPFSHPIQDRAAKVSASLSVWSSGQCKVAFLEARGGNENIDYQGDGILFDFAQGREIIRATTIPGLEEAMRLDGQGLPVFCSKRDLVAYARELHEQVQRPGTPAPELGPEVQEIVPQGEDSDDEGETGSSDVDMSATEVPKPLALIGEHPSIVLEAAWARKRLHALLGNDIVRFEERMTVGSELERDGDHIVGTACMEHLCTTEEAAVAIDLEAGDIHVAILTCPGKVDVFSPPGVPTPMALERIVAEMKAYEEPECG